MNKNLEHYIRIYNVLDKTKCLETVTELQHSNFDSHYYYNNVLKEYSNHTKELSVSFDSSTHTAYFMEVLWNTIKQYLEDLSFNWYSSWAGFSSIRYNRYSIGNEMKLHCDHIQTLFDGEKKGIPTLSIVGLLNDDFEGGKFLMFEDREIKLETGDVMIFPSNFLYPHTVTEITKGTRYSFVSWVY